MSGPFSGLLLSAFLRRSSVLVGLCGLLAIGHPSPSAAAAPGGAADRVYAQARSALLQVRTLVQSEQRQSTIGSGFVVSADGLAVTNYHVVSQYALEPSTYRLEYQAPDGRQGSLQLLAIDVANDLAVVRLDRHDLPHLNFDSRAENGTLPQGERLYAIGNPLDLGFTIVEGTYNGAVERNYGERIHFTGALNPGMSGGPAVTAGGGVAGINVARQLSGELVSFLVPTRFAVALLDQARHAAPLELSHVRDELGRQLSARQSLLYEALGEAGFKSVAVGPYTAPESAAPWFSCWGGTNADEQPKPLTQTDSTRCHADTGVFVSEELHTGSIDLSHLHLHHSRLNAFQFSSLLSRYYLPQHGVLGGSGQTAPARCHDEFLRMAEDGKHPLLRAAWCARGYRDFPTLYDVSVTAVTADRSREALIAQLSLHAISYDAALVLGRRFLDTIHTAAP